MRLTGRDIVHALRKSITCEIRDQKMFEIIGMQYLHCHHFPRTNAVRGR